MHRFKNSLSFAIETLNLPRPKINRNSIKFSEGAFEERTEMHVEVEVEEEYAYAGMRAILGSEHPLASQRSRPMENRRIVGTRRRVDARVSAVRQS